MFYNMSNNEEIIIYIYKNKHTDKIRYELFNIKHYFDLTLCENNQIDTQTTIPTTIPTSIPSTIPTTISTIIPSTIPTSIPSTIPTTIPTTIPSTIPTSIPTAIPTTLPTTITTTILTTISTTTPVSITNTILDKIPISTQNNILTTLPASIANTILDNISITAQNDIFTTIPDNRTIALQYNISTNMINDIPTSISKSIPNSVQLNTNINFDQKQIISLTDFRNLISKNITSFVNLSSIIEGDNFTAIILTSNDMDVQSQLEKGISAVDLGNCTEVIKSHYNISSEENLIVLNLESKNNNSDISENSFNLGKNIQIEIYDNSGRKLDLSVCKEGIKLFMNLEDVEDLNIETSKKYSQQGIDVFNPTDNFFNDLCHKYDNIDGIDIIIDDRRNDIYQNATFCQSGCVYNGVDYDLMTANCLCDSSILQKDEKNNNTSDIEEEKEVLNFKTLSKSFISSLLDFNIEVIFCYNFSF